MIGGIDIMFEGRVAPDDFDVILRIARAFWSSAFVESGDGTIAVGIGAALRTPWAIPCELFLYENRAAYASWTADGLTDQNADQLISVSVEEDCISFVVSGEKTPSHELAAAIIDALRRNRWLALAPARAA